MDNVKIIKTTIKKNLPLAIILVVLAIVGGILHTNLQSINYVSNFKTNNGYVEYTLLRSLTDFENISTKTYDIKEERIEEIKNDISEYKISYIEETAASYSFTLTTKNETLDPMIVQEDILELLNNNRFIKNTQAHEINIMKRKLDFLKQKISQLDSLMLAPSVNSRISEIPSDLYLLFSQQLDLEEKIESTGNFRIIKPLTDTKINKRPVLLFITLYLVVAAFIFLIFSKKTKPINL